MNKRSKQSPPSLKQFAEAEADAGATPEALKKLLRRRSQTLEDISQALKCSRGRALDLCDELKLKGLNVIDLGGRFEILSTPQPSSFELTIESDDNGEYEIGCISDNHYGSKYCREDVNEDLYDIFRAEGIKTVLNGGNWLDGESRFNKFDLINRAHGMQNQIDYVVERYPQRKGITTYYVAGDDHEGWYAQREGVDIGQMLQDSAEKTGRYDLKYLGYIEAFVTLRHKPTGNASKLLLMHPGGGSAYAFSYAPQKIIEALSGGEKPAVLLLGHYHKMSFDVIRNVFTVQIGCTKDLDPFGRKKRLAYHVGGVRLHLQQDAKGAIVECWPRFKQYFDRGYENYKYSLSGAVKQRGKRIV